MVVQKHMKRGWGRACLFLLALTLLSLHPALASKKATRGVSSDNEDVKGPVVRHAITAPPPEGGNVTSADAAKKKSIAQIIDEALEQEFPEEKREKIGKNYNETALQEDVRQLAAALCCAGLCLLGFMLAQLGTFWHADRESHPSELL